MSKLLSILFFCLIFTHCNSSGISGQDQVRQLNPSEFDLLKNELKKYSFGQIQDTIIIKYEYDRESCWNNLDQQNDEYIKTVISERQNFVLEQVSKRKNLSFFHFKEPGKNFNKIISWDNRVLTDTAGVLKNLYFPKSNFCGNSAIILPDGKMIFIKSDAHFDALKWNQDKIRKVLN